MADYGSSSFDWTGTQPQGGGTNVSATRGSQPYNQPTSRSINKAAVAGAGIEAIGGIMGGINALTTAKFNAGLERKQGSQQFKTIMGNVKQAVGEFTTQQAVSGVRSQSAADVKRAGMSTGIRDATTAQYNSNIEAANLEAAGRAAKNKAITGAATTMLRAF